MPKSNARRARTRQRMERDAPVTRTPKVIVELREYERGWGSRVDEIKKFNTRAEAEAFCADFNKVNNKPTVPDWYMVAVIVGVR